MPCGNPPHKRNRKGRATDEQRAEMVRLAIEDNPHFELSLIEMHEEGYTYTYRTLEQLNKANPDTEYYFIIGADSLLILILDGTGTHLSGSSTGSGNQRSYSIEGT